MTNAMALLRITLLLILPATALLAGCRCPSGCGLPILPAATCPTQLTLAEPGPPDLFAVTPACAFDSGTFNSEGGDACVLTPLPSPDQSYRGLDPTTCQCTAAANASTADMIELERHWARIVIECDSEYVQKNMCMQRDLLALQASAVRNRAAGDALTALYRLAALEARQHYLLLAIEETSDSVNRVERFESMDLPIDIDGESLAIELATLEDQLLQVKFARLQLNGQLQKLLGCEICETDFFWPQIDWAPDLSPVDPAAAVELGLANRHDFRAVQLVHCQLDKTTLRVARGVLAVVDGSLGSVEPTEGWIHRLRCIRCNDSEVPIRCKQLAILCEDTRRAATAEIKNAAFEIALQQNRVVLARENVAQRRQRLAELLASRDVDEVPVFEISKARGDLYEAEGSLIEQISSLHLARVNLRSAQGMLAVECGFAPKLCWQGCCNGDCTKCQPPECLADTCPCPKECR
jgi:hypothetical protein